MLVPSRSVRVILLPAILVTWTLYHYTNASYRTATIPLAISPSPPLSSALSETDIFDFPALDSEAFRTLCSKTEWNPNLIFTCNDSGGGVGNLRNSILNCVRYTIAAGASLTLPKVQLRNPANIADIWQRERISFDYIFDKPHFVESLKLSCPQMRVYESIDKSPHHALINSSIYMEPEKIVPEKDVTPEGIAHPEHWREIFYTWLANTTETARKSKDITSHPAIIDLARSYLQYPIYTDPSAFAISFGGILKFRTDARLLATTVLRNLLSSHNIKVDLTSPIWKNAFFGAHLRTEKDSRQGWPWDQVIASRYDTQATYYLSAVISSNLSLIYLASGDPAEIAHFSQDAKEANLTVVTKDSLITGEERGKLKELSFDQQALIDYLVLLKSSQFAGVGHSSFAWNIALKRHVFAERRRDVNLHLKGPQIMNDEYSQVIGTVNQYPEYASCLWP
jgi:hypothetical protein